MGRTMTDPTLAPVAVGGVEAPATVAAAPTASPVETPAPVVPPTEASVSTDVPPMEMPAPVEQDADPTGLVEDGSLPEVPTPPMVAEQPAAPIADVVQENAADANPVQEARDAQALQAAADQLKELQGLPGADERNSAVGVEAAPAPMAPTESGAAVAPANESVELKVAAVEPATITDKNQLVTPQ